MISRTVRNSTANVVGEALWGFQSALVTPATVLVILLNNHGADERTTSLISAIETGGLLLPQILGPFLFRSRSRLKQHMLIYHFIAVIPFLFAIAAAAAWPGSSQSATRIAILGCFAAYIIAIGAVVAAWNAWFAHLFDVSIRGTVSGIIWCAMAAGGALGGLVSGRIIHTWQDANPYPWLYGLAGIIAALSIATYWVIDDPAAQEPDPPRLGARELLARCRRSFADGNFRAFILARILGNAGFCVAPLIALHFLSAEAGSVSQDAVVTCGVGLTIGAAVSSLIFGRLGDRLGHRVGLASGFALLLVALSALMLADGLIGCAIVYALMGLATGCVAIASQNLQIETCPHDSRISHLIAGSLVIGIGGAIVPIIVGSVAAGFGRPVAFACCLAASAVALVWTLIALRDPRHPAVPASST
ncbi:MAG: MFS transporter [Planctomycetes bacterium]|nr:MFS transporter [Planctomycetota bacterium]